jgi:Survival motor neuron (SMN) interacting protein 1 (SIP1)
MKRKREELDDSDDDDEPTYGKQILPVANLPQDFDQEPVDGMQYLFTVRYVTNFSST